MRRLATAFAISAVLPLSGCVSYYVWNNWKEDPGVSVYARVKDFDSARPTVEWKLDRRVGWTEKYVGHTVQARLEIAPSECGPGNHPDCRARD